VQDAGYKMQDAGQGIREPEGTFTIDHSQLTIHATVSGYLLPCFYLVLSR
jgi:hypothetical protein